LLAEQCLAFCENLRDVRTQPAGLRIDNLKLFFNAERELLPQHINWLSIYALRSSGLAIPEFIFVARYELIQD